MTEPQDGSHRQNIHIHLTVHANGLQITSSTITHIQFTERSSPEAAKTTEDHGEPDKGEGKLSSGEPHFTPQGPCLLLSLMGWLA